MELGLRVLSGAGNRFALLELAGEDPPDLPGLARLACDPSRGPGADGLVLFGLEAEGLVRFRLWNADGSVAEVSGNGLRCCARAALDAGLVAGARFAVRSDAGRHEVLVEGGAISTSMGQVAFEGPARLASGEVGELASIGNPHLVLLREALSGREAEEEGPGLQGLREGGINVEFIAPAGPSAIDLVVYERGVGPTMACGTGSCVAAEVAVARGLVSLPVEVRNPGGSLVVSRARDGGLMLGGPVEEVATATVGWPA